MPYQDGYPPASAVALADLINVCQGSTGTPGTGTTRQATVAQVIGAVIVNQTPASASAAGVAGTIAWDSGFIYVCVATNTWKRVAISTW